MSLIPSARAPKLLLHNRKISPRKTSALAGWEQVSQTFSPGEHVDLPNAVGARGLTEAERSRFRIFGEKCFQAREVRSVGVIAGFDFHSDLRIGRAARKQHIDF